MRVTQAGSIFAVVSLASAMVGAMPLAAQEQANGLRAVIRSANEASIGTDAGTRVVALPFKEGTSFKKDDVLVAFDCARNRSELKAAQAEWKSHALVYQNNLNLQKYHAAGNNEVLISKAQADKAEAIADGWVARVAQCEIHAPFDGSVADVFIHLYEMPNPTAPIIRIVDLAHLEVDMIVPSNAVAHVKTGDAFSLRVDETGETVQGHVVRISAAVDPVSQTVKMIGALDASRRTILPGMSGRAQFAMAF